jgi:ABC-type nitrate/sulfonate/bicarbonate transport system substrate-binding protein
MSTLDQPLLIANSNYHVGQQTSIRVAEEQGYFQQEGLQEWVYECRGLLPGALEREGLARIMEEHGVDVATAVDVPSILYQRLKGADLYIVGGWRFNPPTKLFGGKHLRELRDLRGRRIGTREPGGMGRHGVAAQLRAVDLNPDTDVEWVYDRVFSYGFDDAQLTWLREGRVDAMAAHEPFASALEHEGFPVLIDPLKIYPGGKPGKVIVATGRVLEHRANELAAFLRANTRAFWFMRDATHMAYLQDLHERWRAHSHNDDERYLRMVTSVDAVEGWHVPISGGLSHPILERIIGELVASGELDRPIALADVLRDELVTAGYADLSARPELQAAHEKALQVTAQYGY